MQYQIKGMDCASCVGKIERALIRMPDVSEVQLNFASQKLTLTLAPDAATDSKDIEKTIKRLGFGVS
uniref:heavy-metal-associated domain-containing protein n=1 Tax=Psychrobacter alimentarius TaxID=261164 RepID=UPI0019191D55